HSSKDFLNFQVQPVQHFAARIRACWPHRVLSHTTYGHIGCRTFLLILGLDESFDLFGTRNHSALLFDILSSGKFYLLLFWTRKLFHHLVGIFEALYLELLSSYG